MRYATGEAARPAVLLTGATGKLGRALADALAADGFDLVLHCRARVDEAGGLARRLCARHAGLRAFVLQADLADSGQADALADGAAALAGRLDAVVNNASAYPSDTLDTLDFSALAAQTALHVYAPLALIRALARRRAASADASDASVVNILDARAGDRDPGHAAYLLSKGMMADLTRQAAAAYAPGLRVNGVAPGALAPASRAARAAPLARAVDPGEAAAAAVWLLRARSVTGEIIHVDAGRHLRRGWKGVCP